MDRRGMKFSLNYKDIIPAGKRKLFETFPFWTRLEPRSRSSDLSAGVEARVADPLWMLTRQWQAGEFQAEDAGTPIKVQAKHETKQINHIMPPEYPNNPVELQIPVETAVERQNIMIDWRLRIKAGQRFEQILVEKFPARHKDLIARSRSTLPVMAPEIEQRRFIDKDTQQFLYFMAGRVTDGGPILAEKELVRWNELPPEVAEDLSAAASDLRRSWYNKLFIQPGHQNTTRWKPERLCYQLKQGTENSFNTGLTSLVVDEYRNGALDWYAYDFHKLSAKGWTEHKPQVLLPTRIKVSGASPRWWTFEDGMIDFGHLEADSTDMVKLSFLEFALVYGDDWFSFPLEMVPGSLCRIKSLKVTDVFGIETDVPPARNDNADPLKAWSLFDLASSEKDLIPGTANILYVPKVAGMRLESRPVEEVQFIRDDMARLVWGVEEIIPNGLGKPKSGFSLHLEEIERDKELKLTLLDRKKKEILNELKNQNLSSEQKDRLEKELHSIEAAIEKIQLNSSQGKQGKEPLYRLASPVPENWIPFIPFNKTPFSDPGYDWDKPVVDIKLRRGRMLRNAEDEEPKAITAKSQLMGLDHEALLWLNEESISKAGVRVQLVRKMVRDSEGKLYLWMGKKVLYGHGEGRSGLQFDYFLNSD